MKQSFPIDIREDGNSNFISDINEQLSKALSPIEVTKEGIIICLNDEHSEKTEWPNEVTEEGVVICVIDEHSENYFLEYIVYLGLPKS